MMFTWPFVIFIQIGSTPTLVSSEPTLRYPNLSDFWPILSHVQTYANNNINSGFCYLLISDYDDNAELPLPFRNLSSDELNTFTLGKDFHNIYQKKK